MTKALIAILCLPAAAFCSAAGPFALEGEPFRPRPGVEVVWGATNALPSVLRVYRVVPQDFSAKVLSNLMAIGRFSKDDLSRPARLPLPDKNLIRFQDRKGEDWTRYLNIAPTLGWVEYYSPLTPKDPVEALPTKAEVEALAQEFLSGVEIPRSQLCDKRSGYDATRGKIDQHGHKSAPEVFRRGISFARRIDGIQARGYCLMINFGNQGRITYFSLSWRNLKPQELHQVAKPVEMVASIRAGHAVLPPQAVDLAGLDNADRLRIVRLIPQYYEKPGHEPLEWVYPYADLEVVAEAANTNMTTFYLRCPILGPIISRVENPK
jgi:hypothetical protein